LIPLPTFTDLPASISYLADMPNLPEYYTALAPFQDVFRNGTPVLTYHHIGPRKRGARLKCLYVPRRLFQAQLAELRHAGFTTESFRAPVSPSAPAQPRIALTFDDGFLDVFENALPLLLTHKFTSIQFLVSDLLGKTNEWQQAQGDVVEPLMDDSQIRDWLAAGQAIGAHTRTHPRLTQVPLAQAREEIFGSRKSLQDRFGIPIDHVCYPYGDWNPQIRDLVREAGYQSAYTTTPGMNGSADSPFELKRFTARYRSRNLKNLFPRLSS